MIVELCYKGIVHPKIKIQKEKKNSMKVIGAHQLFNQHYSNIFLCVQKKKQLEDE